MRWIWHVAPLVTVVPEVPPPRVKVLEKKRSDIFLKTSRVLRKTGLGFENKQLVSRRNSWVEIAVISQQK